MSEISKKSKKNPPPAASDLFFSGRLLAAFSVKNDFRQPQIRTPALCTIKPSR